MNLLVSFIGVPGSGKTTNINLLKDYFKDNAISISVHGIIKYKNNNIYDLTSEQKKIIDLDSAISKEKILRGELAPFSVDKIMFDLAIKYMKEGKIVILDGAPRGEEQAVYFYDLLEIEGFINKYVIIQLTCSSDEVEFSKKRQYNRDLEEVGPDIANRNKEKYLKKIGVFRNHTKKGLEYLTNKGVKTMKIDCMEQSDVVHANILKEIINNF